jgi:hypothetical protein
MMFSAAVRAPSKNTSLNSRLPVSWRMPRISTPFCCSGTSRKHRPRWPLLPGSQRASTKIQSASCALEVQIFWPCSRHSPVCSSRTARVCTLARSEPALGSE